MLVFMGVLSKLNLFCSRSTMVSESGTEEEKQRQDDRGFRAPSPLVHGRISSDESEAEGPEDPVEFPSSAAHPKPLAVSRFYKSFSIFALIFFLKLFQRKIDKLFRNTHVQYYLKWTISKKLYSATSV